MVAFLCSISSLWSQSVGYQEALAQARVAAKRGDYEAAVRYYTKCIGFEPGISVPRMERANAYHHLGKLSLAMVDAEAVIKLKPRSLDGYLARGTVRFRQGELSGAMEDVGRVLKINPQDADGYGLRGKIRHAMRDYDGAVADYTQVTKLNPTDMGAVYNRASLYADLQQYKLAIRDLELVVSLQANDIQAWYMLGTLYGRTGQHETAVATFTSILKANPNIAEAYALRGISYSNLNNVEKAMVDLGQAFALGTADKGILAQAHTTRALIYFNSREFAKAEADFSAVLELMPGNWEVRQIRSQVYMILGQTDKALSDVNALVAGDPTRAEGYYRRAHVLGQINDHKAAEAACTKALECDPNFAPALASRGASRFQLGDMDGAQADLDAAEKLDPKLVDVHRARVFISMEKKDLAEAERHATAGCEYSGWKDPSQVLLLAGVCCRAGKFEEGRKWMVKAESLGVAPAEQHELERLRAGLAGRR
ncbi:tetratricopeptide repeat protein [Verrucomicrobium sp. BvORR106]|uniref:tetratricopeptide repeat protein n=1 Tax=Verrucomicrobium sp. BvORR106 TaxID=1403819 RepID=UPI000B16ABD4|nr:tetratricopeptide repeat protein [Verrucomicrobium sp. BvORR106]